MKKYNKIISIFVLMLAFTSVGFTKTENPLNYKEYSKPQYHFIGGITKDARVMQYNGFKIIQPLKLDTNKQKLTVNQIAKEFNKLPRVLKNNVKEIQLLDYSNPEDKQWVIKYNMKGFTSYATSSNNGIKFYANNLKSVKKTVDYLPFALVHESAHLLDVAISSQNNKFSNSKVWTDVMKSDLKGTNDFGLYCSKYSKSSSSNVEDFAEAMVGYCKDKDKFIKEYPNRGKKIEQLLKASQ